MFFDVSVLVYLFFIVRIFSFSTLNDKFRLFKIQHTNKYALDKY